MLFWLRYLDSVREERLDRVSFVEFIVSVWFSKIPSGVWLKASMLGFCPLSLFTNWYIILLRVSVMDKQLRVFEVTLAYIVYFAKVYLL